MSHDNDRSLISRGTSYLSESKVVAEEGKGLVRKVGVERSEMTCLIRLAK